MRRTIMAAVATLSLAAPSAALAHHGERHHHHRGRHHHHVHVLAFHAQAPAGAPGSTSTPAASEEGAGTIASFNEGVLTIKLNDGSTVSGKVDEGTEIECPAVTASAADFGRDHGDDGDDHDRFDDNGRDGPGDIHHGDCPGHEDGGEAGGGHCTTAALVPGASVKEAFLAIGSQGARWVKVEL